MFSAYTYLPIPSARAIFKRSVTGLNSQSLASPRLVASPRLKNPNLSHYFSIAGGRIIGFIPFPRVLVLCEMQSVSSRIWTRIACPIPTTITITPRAPQHIMFSEYMKVGKVEMGKVNYIMKALNSYCWKQKGGSFQ